MIKKLTRHGNSWALILDRSILDLLQVKEDTPLYIATDGKSLTLTPVRDGVSDLDFKDATTWLLKRYRKDLKKLAE